EAHLCCQLVLRRIYRCSGCIARCKQYGNTCRLDEILFSVCRRARRDDSMVVWPQRCRFYSDGRLFGHDVLLCAKTSWTSYLFIPFINRALLGLDFYLYVGRLTSLAL